jgi:uncharacterized protein YjiS (DUF1127 family)
MVENLKTRDVIVLLLIRLARGGDRVVRRWQVNRTAAALENLSDRLLADIGVTRSEIPEIAPRATERVPSAPARVVARDNTRKEVTT